jgi:cytoskeleton protein RodZ
MVDGEIPEKSLFPAPVGERLRVAREAAGLDLNDISTRTRIPLRHLTAIENSNYTELPSQTYALGFAKSYARAIGVDEIALASDLRVELGRARPGERDAHVYEPADPSRVPPRLLAWTAAFLALVIVIGYGIWRGGYFDGADVGTTAAVTAPQETPVVAAAPTSKPATAAAGAGQVVLTATVPVWIRIRDTGKKTLFQKEMAAGESYQVPLTASDPRILTGRPDALKVTIDGREVAPIGGSKTTVRDAGVSAAALNARSVTAPPVAAPLTTQGTTPVAAPPSGVAH